LETVNDFHPVIQLTIRRLTNPDLSLENLGNEIQISKQAVYKKIQEGINFFKTFRSADSTEPTVPKAVFDQLLQEKKVQEALIQTLKQQLILNGVERQLLRFFREVVLNFFPKFKPGRLPAHEKKQILEWLAKFKKVGGLLKTFAAACRLSPETLTRWQEAYDKHGLAGLQNKSTRPKGFGNKVPLFIRQALILLFLKFPKWTPYQYHSHIRHSPTTHWYVSIPTIQKLKSIHAERSQAEKDRLKKRWCFAPGTDVWTIDFTCILKTDFYKLQLLTISDHRSRFLIHADLYLNTSTELIIDQLEELFIQFGKPLIIKADNGPEFRIECKESLRELSVYLFNSPIYYGQFNGAHERIHRTLKTFMTDFEQHQNLTRLVTEVKSFHDQYNYSMPLDYLNGKTPSEVFFNDKEFMPAGAETVGPYEKDGELRMKFKDRDNNPARVSMPVIPTPDPDV
jgi:putative transposase